MRPDEPTRVDDYRLLARLGRGAMGGVYLGRSKGGRVVAVKIVRADLAEDPEFRERFRREASMARSVGGFWTAAVVDADPDADLPWLATEYVPGPTLHQAVAEHGALPESTVRTLGAGLAEALVAIHRAGLVHRDLKPANVLLGPDGPRVIDFGISRAMTGHALTATGIFLGTPGFFSPEQTEGGEVGGPSDVFSLGAVLTFAATGTGPFGEDSTTSLLYRVVHGEPDLQQVPEGLRPLLAACLDKDPAARPTPAQLLDRLGGANPQGDSWLPAAITDVIAQHNTELQRTANEPDNPRPGTLVYPDGEPPAAPAPQPPPQPAPAASPPAGDLREEIVPARARETSEQGGADPTRVRADLPGPVFATGGRGSAAFWTVLFAAIVAGGAWVGTQYGVPEDFQFAFQLGIGLLALCAIVEFARAVWPRLRLKINPDGLRISRAGLNREVPWSQVQRVGVVGRGKSQALAVWSPRGAPGPSSKPWHRVRSFHGGSAVFPIGATGGFIVRRREAKRVRNSLEQYALGRYDSGLS
nr:serine/threonine-protein kinase [Saccharopolyspora sp. HNM0983]